MATECSHATASRLSSDQASAPPATGTGVTGSSASSCVAAIGHALEAAAATRCAARARARHGRWERARGASATRVQAARRAGEPRPICTARAKTAPLPQPWRWRRPACWACRTTRTAAALRWARTAASASIPPRRFAKRCVAFMRLAPRPSHASCMKRGALAPPRDARPHAQQTQASDAARAAALRGVASVQRSAPSDASPFCASVPPRLRRRGGRRRRRGDAVPMQHPGARRRRCRAQIPVKQGASCLRCFRVRVPPRRRSASHAQRRPPRRS